MDFATAAVEVQSLVKRPDKTVEIASQLNRAISFFTMKAKFSQDLVEDTLAIDPALYGQVVDLSALVNFRTFKYIRPTGQRYYLEEIAAEQVFTPGGIIQPDRYFVASTNLTITLSHLDSSLEIGYYTYPITLTGTDTHWMLDIMPYAVIEKAASKVFQMIGDDTSARFYEASSTELFLAVRRDTQS